MSALPAAPQTPVGAAKRPDPATPSQLTGIGVNLHRTTQGTFVIRGVQQRSVAEQSGRIGSGHILVAIDGEAIQGKTLDAVASLVQGPLKSTVTLSLQHATGKYDVQLKRGDGVASGRREGSNASTPQRQFAGAYRSSPATNSTPQSAGSSKRREQSRQSATTTPEQTASPNNSTTAQASSSRPTPPPFLHSVSSDASAQEERLAAQKSLFQDEEQAGSGEAGGIAELLGSAHVWLAVAKLPLVQDDFHAEAVSEVNAMALSVLGDQEGVHSAPVWAGAPDTSIIEYEGRTASETAAGLVQSCVAVRGKSRELTVETAENGADDARGSAETSSLRLYSQQLEGTPHLWRVLKETPLVSDDFRASAARELEHLASQAAIPSPTLDATPLSLSSDCGRWIGGTLRAASIGSGGQELAVQEESEATIEAEPVRGGKVWSLVKSLPLASDSYEPGGGHQFLVLGTLATPNPRWSDATAPGTAIATTSAEDSNRAGAPMAGSASAEQKEAAPLGSGSAKGAVVQQRGRVWSTLVRMPMNMDDFREGSLGEINLLASMVGTPDKPEPEPTPTAHDSTPAGPRDERWRNADRGGVWAAVAQLPLDLASMEDRGQQTLLQIGRDLDPFQTESPLSRKSVDFPSVDDGAAGPRPVDSHTSPSRTSAVDTPTAAEQAPPEGEAASVALTPQAESLVPEGRQESGLPALSPDGPPPERFAADISAISALESPIAGDTSTESDSEEL